MSSSTSHATVVPPESLAEILDEHGYPRWESITLDVPCSRCGYNLRGLAEPRCPECGIQFQWRDLLDGLGRTTNWLFEHNWKQEPIRSWLLTVAAEMRGRAFWQELSIHHYLTPMPLLLMLFAAPIMPLVVSLAIAWVASELCGRIAGLMSTVTTGADTFGHVMLIEISKGLAEYVNVTTGLSGEILILPASTSFLYGALAVVLCCYRQTLAQQRLRTIQVLRVVAHAAFPFGIAFGVLIPTTIAATVVAVATNKSVAPLIPLSVFISLPAVAGFVVGRGLRHYLGIWTGVLTAAVSMLLVMLLYPFAVGLVVVLLMMLN